MTWLTALKSAAESASESPKATAAVSTFSSLAGVATAAQWLTGIFGALAVLAGIGCSLVLIRLNWIKGENEKIRGRLLREKAAEHGVNLSDED